MKNEVKNKQVSIANDEYKLSAQGIQYNFSKVNEMEKRDKNSFSMQPDLHPPFKIHLLGFTNTDIFNARYQTTK